jgi:hypothetical protein
VPQRLVPEWYKCNDTLLFLTEQMLVLATAVENTIEKEMANRLFYKIFLIREYILSGFLSNGQIQQQMVDKERTRGQLLEAADLLGKLANDPDYHDLTNSEGREAYRQGAIFCTEEARSKPEDPAVVTSPIPLGRWVVVMGLMSATGRAMNGAIGSVRGVVASSGRVLVKLDAPKDGTHNDDELKSLKPANLVELPMPEEAHIMMHCMRGDERSRVLKLYKARMDDNTCV